MKDNLVETKVAKKLPLTSDYVFKRIFGQEENKTALKDFLESILNISIQEIQINNPEIAKDFYDSKYGVLDLKVTLDENIIVNIEMQLQNEYNMEQRSVYYMASTYAMQLAEGSPYTDCKKVIVINILNFIYYKRDSYHSIARMKFEPTQENERVDLGYEPEDEYATEYLEMHFIELPKFKKKNPEASNRLEQWLWLFIGGEEEVQKASKVNKEIERINKKLASMSLSREERNNYEFRLKAIRDEISVIAYATQKGLQQGIEQGIEEGKKQGIEQGIKKGEENIKIEIARTLLEKKYPISEIQEILGLSKEKIQEIKNNT